jgi:hypothetical protein
MPQRRQPPQPEAGSTSASAAPRPAFTLELLMKVHVQVNEQGALRNGRYAFGNRYTVLSELLQNARGAGASAVHVEYLEVIQPLRVIDDGCGTDNFQNLLSLHESGWDEQLANSEGAFGMG